MEPGSSLCVMRTAKAKAKASADRLSGDKGGEPDKVCRSLVDVGAQAVRSQGAKLLEMDWKGLKWLEMF